MMKTRVLFLIGIIVCICNNVFAQVWVSDGASCPTQYQSVDCTVPGEVFCGWISPTAYCDTSTNINATIPAIQGSTFTTVGGGSGGYYYNCVQASAACNTWTCSRDASCYSVHRQTLCTANLSATFTCGSCGSGWLDCNGTGDGSDGDGCEIQIGSACVDGDGLPGVYDSTCAGGGLPPTCILTPQDYVTGVDTKFNTTDPNLWSTQYGAGLIAQLRKDGACTLDIDCNTDGNTILSDGTNTYTLNSLNMSYYNVLDYGAPCTDTTIGLAIADISGADATLLIPSGTTCTIANDLNIPSNINLLIAKGGKFSVNDTITLTLNNEIDAGLYQIFDGLGDVSIVNIQSIYPQWFGANSFDALDDTDAIQKAVDSITTGSIIFSEGTFLVSRVEGNTYNAGTTYALDDIVTYGNQSYKSLTAGNVGNTPYNYWMFKQVYSTGDIVIRYNASTGITRVYQSTEDNNIEKDPLVDTIAWTNIGSPVWQPYTDVIITTKDGINFIGLDSFTSIIKVNSTTLPYHAIFGKQLADGGADNFAIFNLRFDFDSLNMVFDMYDTYYAKRAALMLADTNNLSIIKNRFENMSARQVVIVEDNYNVSYNIRIEDNDFLNSGYNAYDIEHDSSMIYIGGYNVSIINNNFYNEDWDAAQFGAAVTAIETHGGNMVIQGNRIEKYALCMNVSGITSYESKENIVSDNFCHTLQYGIQLWSWYDPTHDTDYGLNGIRVSDNIINIDYIDDSGNTRYSKLIGSPLLRGITFEDNLTLPSKDVVIENNIIKFDDTIDTGTIDVSLDNPNFDTDTDWTKGTGWTISGGTASCDGTQTAETILEQSNANIIVANKEMHQIVYTISGYGGGSIRADLGATSLPYVSFNSNGTKNQLIREPKEAKIRFIASSDFIGSIDTVILTKNIISNSSFGIGIDYKITSFDQALENYTIKNNLIENSPFMGIKLVRRLKDFILQENRFINVGSAHSNRGTYKNLQSPIMLYTDGLEGNIIIDNNEIIDNLEPTRLKQSMYIYNNRGGAKNIDIYNSHFSLTNPQTKWTLGDGASISGSKLVYNGTQVAPSTTYQTLEDLNVGQWYKVSFIVEDRTAGSVAVGLGNSGTAVSSNSPADSSDLTGLKPFSYYMQADAKTVDIIASADFVGKVDAIRIERNVSINNYDFATDSIWTKGTGWTISGVANCDGTQVTESELVLNAEYSAITTYALNDLVAYDGSMYRSLQGSNTGNTPSTSSAYWNIEAKKGHYYKVEYDLIDYTSGTLKAGFGNYEKAKNNGGETDYPLKISTKTKCETGIFKFIASSNFIGDIANIKVVEIPIVTIKDNTLSLTADNRESYLTNWYFEGDNFIINLQDRMTPFLNPIRNTLNGVADITEGSYNIDEKNNIRYFATKWDYDYIWNKEIWADATPTTDYYRVGDIVRNREPAGDSCRYGWINVASGTPGTWECISNAAGVSTFAGLTDTPANYTSASLQCVRVNAGETALEFASCSAGDAPSDATYITQTANATLTNEQAMSSLSTGIVKNTTGTGVQSIAIADTDYQQVVTWGDGLQYSTGTASVDYNTPNLQITSTELNTIQDISTASSPSFASLGLTGNLQFDAGQTVDTIETTLTDDDTHLPTSGAVSDAISSLLDESLTSANIFVGNGSNVATGVAMSSEATISNTGAVTLTNDSVIGKTLTGYTAGAGTVSSADSLLSAIQKLDGNISGFSTDSISEGDAKVETIDTGSDGRVTIDTEATDSNVVIEADGTISVNASLSYETLVTDDDDIPNKKYVDDKTYTSIEDADGDTKIQVEESADEDIIRFDTAGTERAIIDDTQLQLANDFILSWNNYAGTSSINAFEVDTDNNLNLLSSLNNLGIIYAPEDSYSTFADENVTTTPADSTQVGYVFKLDGNNILSIEGEADGLGGVDNLAFKNLVGQKINITDVNAATYDLDYTDYILSVSYTSTASVTSLTLMTEQCNGTEDDGRVIIIKDAGGSAGANNITIDTEGSETIDGSATAVISTNYDSVSLYCQSSNWYTY